jgi:hypothetical protein
LNWLPTDQDTMLDEIKEIVDEIVSYQLRMRVQKDESTEELLESLNQVF